MKKTALIMAGGRGERFWPKSRKDLPKQFLSLTDDGKTMIQLTVERILPLMDLEDIYIATNKNYKSLVLKQLPGLPEENVLCEPVGRNTAPCIGLGAVHIASKYDNATMFVLPSDHLIKMDSLFIETLKKASEVAEKGTNLVTIGITPNYPETGYGYIQYDATVKNQGAFAVNQFVEKPNLEKAREYLNEGNYLWNSGMFIWTINSILENLKQYMPETYSGLLNIQNSIGTPEYEQTLSHVFPNFNSESIDYGIMEKASDIYILPGNFGWDDVGSWLAVGRIKSVDSANNVVNGNVVFENISDCIIEGSNKLIAVVGLKNTVIVDTPDATLVCSKDSADGIKKILEQLKSKNLSQYL